jgi:nucleotide-binding universal stress UspA family protein
MARRQPQGPSWQVDRQKSVITRLMKNTILCPTDFSHSSNQALQYALDLAHQLDAKLLILHVKPPAPALPGDSATSGEEEGAVPLLPGLSSESCEYMERTGDPADAIVQTARDFGAAQIVMGSHGRRGHNRVLLGSTAEAVVHRASCPVTVVKNESIDA